MIDWLIDFISITSIDNCEIWSLYWKSQHIQFQKKMAGQEQKRWVDKTYGQKTKKLEKNVIQNTCMYKMTQEAVFA